jgi:hypothetical protein
MLRGDDRGQSVQIGAILLFALFIVGLSFTQAFVVPQENKSVEFGSYVEASDDLTAYYHDLLAAGTQGSQTGQTVETGVRYPARTILINPGPAAGTVRTTGTRNVTITDVEAVSGEDRNVRGFWDTDARGPRNYSTRHVEFDPGYNEFDASPVVVSSVGTYRLGSGGQVALTEQSFLSGNRITLVTIDGDVESGGLSTSLSAAPTSVATRSVTVTGDGGSDFTITVPVPGNATAWNASSGARSLRANPNVVGTEVNGSRVDVTFDGGREYTLRLAKVTVRGSSDSSVETEPEPAYVVPLTSNGTAVPTEGATEVAVEVRDEYNNPVGGTNVSFTTADGSFDGASVVTTDSAGTATVSFNISDSVDTADVSVRVVDEGVTPYNSTTIMLVRQGSGNDGAGTDEINPSSDGDVQLVEAISTANTEIEVQFNNTAPETRTIEKLRISFYFASQNDRIATNMSIDDNTGTKRFFDVPGTTNDVVESFPANTESDATKLSLTVEETTGGSGAKTDDDFFILTIWFEEAEKETYFVSVRN